MSGRRPPRLLFKTMAVTFLTVAVLLIVVLIIVTVNVRRQVRESVGATLESEQRVFAALESRRQRELRAQVAILAENPTLKAAADTYQAERQFGDERSRGQSLTTIGIELGKLATRLESDGIVLIDQSERVLASAGRLAERWPAGRRVVFSAAGATGTDKSGTFDGIVHGGSEVFRAVAVPLVLENDVTIGRLYMMAILDQRYADDLASLAGTRTAIVSGGLLVATTLPAGAAREFESTIGTTPGNEGTVSLGGESYAYRRLVQVGDTSFFGLASIDESSLTAMRQAMIGLGLLAVLATVLGLVASFWLARTVSQPIDRLSRALASMAAVHKVDARLVPSGSSREVDDLTDTFNALMQSLVEAEAETQGAYTGAIRALAAALDARDPYTAGHSERVSVLSVAIGRGLALSADDIEVIRLGALLHDIGKIGVPDDVLRKPGALTADEFEFIRQHPVLGARILRSVPFLARHIPIVELHHERPDGRGYPLGLRGDDIPLAARIVHVADAYDAMTSARAYRGARPSVDALKELWRCAGTEFHADIVGALATALPGVTFEPAPRALESVG